MTAVHLRPIERRVLAMRDQGMSDDEIGVRVRKSAGRVAQIADWAALPGRGELPEERNELLTPLERRVVAMRAEGQSHEEIGEAFRRSARFIKQVEGIARFRQYRDLLA